MTFPTTLRTEARWPISIQKPSFSRSAEHGMQSQRRALRCDAGSRWSVRASPRGGKWRDRHYLRGDSDEGRRSSGDQTAVASPDRLDKSAVVVRARNDDAPQARRRTSCDGQRHRALTRNNVSCADDVRWIRDVPAIPVVRDGLREYGWLVQLLAILLILGVGAVAALHTVGMARGRPPQCSSCSSSSC